MKKTQNYGLNQWEASDRIRMEDFNSDNAALEAALGQKTGRMELILQDDSFDAGVYLVSAPITKIQDFDQWEQVIIVLDCHETAFLDADMMHIRLTARMSTELPHTDVYMKAGSMAVVISPRHDKSNTVRAFFIGNGCNTAFTGFSYQDFSSIFFMIEQEGAGVPTTKYVSPVITIYGIR